MVVVVSPQSPSTSATKRRGHSKQRLQTDADSAVSGKVTSVGGKVTSVARSLKNRDYQMHHKNYNGEKIIYNIIEPLV